MFIAEQNFEKATLESKMEQKGSGYMKNYQADMQTAFDPTGAKPSNFQFYFGPNHFKTLLASNDLSFKDRTWNWKIWFIWDGRLSGSLTAGYNQPV